MIWTKASQTPFRRRIQFPPPTPQFLPAVMDNVPAHKADGVRQAIEAAGEDGLTVLRRVWKARVKKWHLVPTVLLGSERADFHLGYGDYP
jgi:hypothetical protein